MDLDTGREPQSSSPSVSLRASPKELFRKESLSSPFTGIKSCVSRLQEYCVSRKENSPHYQQIDEEGPSHLKVFTIRCTLGFESVIGRGSSKKLAKQNAAASMLNLLETYPSYSVEDRQLENNLNTLHLEPEDDHPLKLRDAEKITAHTTVVKPSPSTEQPPDLSWSLPEPIDSSPPGRIRCSIHTQDTSHSTHECPDFLNLKLEDRMQHLRRELRCYTCAGPHSTMMCNSKDLCSRWIRNDFRLNEKPTSALEKQKRCSCPGCIISRESSQIQGPQPSPSGSPATPRNSTPHLHGYETFSEDDIFKIAPLSSAAHSAAKLRSVSNTLHLTLKEHPVFLDLFEISAHSAKLATLFHAFNEASRQHFLFRDTSTSEGKANELQRVRQQLTSDYANMQMKLTNQIVIHARSMTKNQSQW